MFHFFHRGVHTVTQRQAGPAGTGLLFNGLLCVLFGLAIFANPDLLALLVAVLLIVFGVSLLAAWWKIRRWK